MRANFQKLPLVISVPAIFILMMMVPAVHGFYVGNHHEGRTFLYAVLLGLFLLGFLSFLVHDESFFTRRHGQLWSLFAFFLGLPIFLAIPFHEIMKGGSLINFYLDLVSVITTTGLPVFPGSVLSETIVIWRVCLGWASGFLIWVFSWSLFAQLNLSGFEHQTSVSARSGLRIGTFASKAELPAERFWRESARLGPIYFCITAGTALLLLIATGDPVFAILRAMSTIATFGVEIPRHTETGWSIEAILVLLMFFAISRSTFSNIFSKTRVWKFSYDPEIFLAAILIILAMLILTILSLSKNFQINGSIDVIWGAFFTSISFLTTTGLTSFYIPDGLGEFGPAQIVFAALAMLGGGVATTAGGIKLIRVYVLSKHCEAEINHLITPSQVASGQRKNVSRDTPNAMLACVFLILFILVFATITLGLTITGSSAGEALHLTLATLTNTGPLANGFGNSESIISELGTPTKIILVFSMVCGRMEVLALLALFNPDIYR